MELPELKIISEALTSLKAKNIIRTKNLVGDLGEYYCKKLFALTINSNTVEKGFDATDKDGKKVEIKTRRTPEGKSKVIFRGFDFDYCLFVMLNEDFQLVTILKISSQELKNNLEYKGDRLSVSKIKTINHESVFRNIF